MSETLKERMDREAKGKVLIHWMIEHPDGQFGIDEKVVFGRPATYGIACNLGKKAFARMEQASGETHVVNCADCMQHPRFAAEYEPSPKIQRYEDIPEEVRKLIALHEARQVPAPSQGI